MFIDYFPMTDKVWMDTLSGKIRDRIALLIADRDRDKLFPLSNCFVEYFHSALDMNHYAISIFTEDTIFKQNHFLIYFNKNHTTQDVLIWYDYNCTNETKSNCDYKNDIY